MKSTQETINEIVKIARLIKDGKEDVVVGIRRIYGLWTYSDLPEDDLYYLIMGLDSETDTFVKGEDQKNCTAEFLEEQAIEEKETLEFYRPLIEKAIEQLLQLPFVEIPEDPYAWPFEEYK